MKRPFKRILYGGDYNPNQWEKEVWKEDMRIFKDARINSATINVFPGQRSSHRKILTILQNWMK